MFVANRKKCTNWDSPLQRNTAVVSVVLYRMLGLRVAITCCNYVLQLRVAIACCYYVTCCYVVLTRLNRRRELSELLFTAGMLHVYTCRHFRVVYVHVSSIKAFGLEKKNANNDEVDRREDNIGWLRLLLMMMMMMMMMLLMMLLMIMMMMKCVIDDHDDDDGVDDDDEMCC